MASNTERPDRETTTTTSFDASPPPTNNKEIPRHADLESASLANGGPRVRFASDRQGHFLPLEAQWKPLAAALKLSEESGAAPVLPDGKIGGNGALILEDGSMLVSRSGREADKEFLAEDFVRVVGFDDHEWRASYRSADPSFEPSSDTPLLWHALVVAPSSLHWTTPHRPTFVLHGHSCATEEEARARNFPCSPRETLFSTPEDTEALAELFETHPYPQHNVFVRKNHGFFLLARSGDEAIDVFKTKILSPLPTTTKKKDDCAKRERTTEDDDEDEAKEKDDDAKRRRTDDDDDTNNDAENDDGGEQKTDAQ